ncbi:MAG: molybdopterin biosynthesis protein MoeY [Halioglobus sp.]|nr:molybdopterin biosynthesis protein MoeY [Halioglobus sp.]
MGGNPAPGPVVRERAVERVLDLARWAPSGDNEQPWRFEITSDTAFTVHGHDTRDWCVYDLDGTSSQIAIGAMLETAAIAASTEGLRLDWRLRDGSPEEQPLIDATLTPDDSIAASPLASFITERTTQRLPFTQRPLTAASKAQLEAAVGEDHRVIWLEGDERKRVAKLLFHNAHIRLSTPEAHAVHQKNIEWGARFSEDRLPEYALGIDAPTRKVMRFALGSWQRVQFLNRFFAGTWLPRLQMDLRTGRNCAAHFVIVANKAPSGLEDYFAAGAAMQRFWLRCASLGLQFQPEMTPLIFSRYVRDGLRFTVVAAEQELAGRLATQFNQLVPDDHEPAQRVYMGRVGFGPTPTSRSIRPPLEKLLVQPG